MVKLIVSDLDGTLVPLGNGAMDPEVFPTIAALREKGVQFCVATGRQYPGTYNLFGEQAKELYYVTNNGADVHFRGETLMVTPIPETPLIDELIDEVQADPELDMDATCPSKGYMSTEHEELFLFMRDNVGYIEDNVPDLHNPPEPYIKLAVHQMGRPANADEALVEKFREKYGELFQVTGSGNGWIDFMPYGVNKGRGIRFIREKLGLSPSEVVIFGDNENDVSMFTEGVSYVMDTAMDSVKEKADFVTNDVVREMKKILSEV